jgi:hypothetical protein
MALDTAEKRASALGRSLPFLRVLPFPDGSIDASDRLQLVWLYRIGDEGGVPEPIVPDPEHTFYVRARPHTFIVRQRSHTFKVK